MKIVLSLVLIFGFLFSNTSPTLEEWNKIPKEEIEKMLKRNGVSKTLKEISKGINSLISENGGEIKIDYTTSIVSSHYRDNILILKNVTNKKLYIEKLKSNFNNVFSTEQIEYTLNNTGLKKELINEIKKINVNSYCTNNVYKTLIYNNILFEFIFHFDNGKILGTFNISKKDCETIKVDKKVKELSFDDMGFSKSNPTKNNKIKKVIKYFSNGNIKIKSQVKNNMLNGEFVEYYPNGNIHHITTYKNNKLNGSYKQYYEKKSFLKHSEFYSNGIPNGLFEEYYSNGKLKSKVHYLYGEKHLNSSEYYSNGNIKNKWNYKFNKLEGIQKQYYQNGNLKIEFNMKNGKLDGIIMLYKENGKLEKIETYINGILTNSKTI